MSRWLAAIAAALAAVIWWRRRRRPAPTVPTSTNDFQIFRETFENVERI